MHRPVLAALGLLTLAGCTTPYPNDPLYFEGASLDANRAPRGSRAFCERYADQTTVNQYDTLRDPDDGFGGNLFNRRQAEAAGARAYERCLAGRTN